MESPRGPIGGTSSGDAGVDATGTLTTRVLPFILSSSRCLSSAKSKSVLPVGLEKSGCFRIISTPSSSISFVGWKPLPLPLALVLDSLARRSFLLPEDMVMSVYLGSMVVWDTSRAALRNLEDDVGQSSFQNLDGFMRTRYLS